MRIELFNRQSLGLKRRNHVADSLVNFKQPSRQVAARAAANHSRLDDREPAQSLLNNSVARNVEARIDADDASGGLGGMSHEELPIRHSVAPPLRSSSVMPISVSELRILSPVAKSLLARASARSSIRSCIRFGTTPS